MKNKQLKSMMNGAVLLSVASLVAKILSAVYRVPFQNMVGNTGFYVYQQVYPIYGIGMTFALSGFPVFFSKAIAEAVDPLDHQRLMKQSLLILSTFSALVFMGIYLFASPIAALMGDSQLTPIIQSVSWMFLFMPLLATLRGYFQGTYRMEPTAISQVTEQLVRVVVILIAAYWFTQTGTDLYAMGASAMSGASWGAALALVVLLMAAKKNDHPLLLASKSQSVRKGLFQLTKRYATEGLTICLLTSILVLFQLIDSFSLYKGLVESGIDADTAKSLKGIYDRGQPLVQLGMVVVTGFSASFIPMLTQAFVSRQADRFQYAAKSLIRITLTLSLAATVGLLAILPEVNQMLFGDRSGQVVLAIYVMAIAAASLVMAFHSILQSENQYRLTLYALAIGLVVKLALNSWLVSSLGTLGASIATLTGLVIMAIFLASKLSLSMTQLWRTDHFLLKLVGGAGMLYITAVMTKWVLTSLLFQSDSRSQASIVALLTVVIGVIVFVVYILRVQLFTIREWLSLPFGKKLLKKGVKG